MAIARQLITPCLWYDDRAEEAANFYCSVFKNSRITQVSRYPDAGQEIHQRPAGSVMVVAFELDGQPFTALNGGPVFKFDEAVSFQIMCETQDEVDFYWNALTAGGQERPCGWLKDKFGLSWQVVPSMIPRMMSDPDATKTARVMNAFLQMKKLDIAAIERAYAGHGGMNKPAQYGERTLTLTRVFDAPRELVWRAWTDPKHLAQWFGPRGFTSSVPELDLRVGGALRIVMHGPDGNDYPMKGVFREVVAPERLVFGNIAIDKDGNHLLEGETTVILEEQGDKTKLTLHAYAKGLVPIAPQMLAGMEAGWSQSLDKLGETLRSPSP
jgi:predicted 3-demethylubiquinone-9 3-methyltransferase (glyoxalase superfamily)/uncharacterized protein YndB with AHSA1/START domain